MTATAITDEQHHVCRLPRDRDPRNQGREYTCTDCYSEFTLTLCRPAELGHSLLLWIRTYEPPNRAYVAPKNRGRHRRKDRVSHASRETTDGEPQNGIGTPSSTGTPTDSGAGAPPASPEPDEATASSAPLSPLRERLVGLGGFLIWPVVLILAIRADGRAERKAAHP